LTLAKVRDIAFYDGHTFHKYPRGINDILRLSLIYVCTYRLELGKMRKVYR
jgi:hypothetical protein